ncbi:MAG: RNA-binding domain-containing protein [Bacteroides sp.]
MYTASEIEALIAQGEGQTVEFKETMPKRLVDLATTACAFANSAGGVILIGVNDKGVVVGTDFTNAQRSEVQSALQALLPPISIAIYPVGIGERLVWVLDVPEGSEKPYTVRGTIYQREGASSQKTTSPHQMRKLFYAHEDAPTWDERTTTEVDLLADLDVDTLRAFRQRALLDAETSNEQILKNLHLFGPDGNPKRGGVLFFTRQGELLNGCARVQCVLFKGLERVDIMDAKEYAGPLPEQYSNTMRWLKQTLKVRLSIEDGGPHREVWELPEKALREVVVNSLAHRDYSDKGAMTQVHVFDDRLEVSNPGGLLPEVAKEFGTRSSSRNRVIFPLFRQMHLVEQMGSGIPRIRREMSNAGLPAPEFVSTYFFTVTLRRPTEWLPVNG